MRRHLVRKSAKAQVVHVSKDHKEPMTRHRKQDRQPHEVRGLGAGCWAGMGDLVPGSGCMGASRLGGL